MAAPMKTYAEWLEDRLKSVNPEIDTDVFVTYLIGILEEEDLSSEEREESISGFLGEIAESDREVLCSDIITQWDFYNKSQENLGKGDNATAENLSSMFVKQSLGNTTVRKERTEEQKAQKEAVLAQFRNMNDDEILGEDDPGGSGAMGSTHSEDFFEKNTNKDTVVKMQKEMREKSKQESAAKKEKIKQDREKQKQKQQERKDAEKKRTQKGERKR